jgi:hypothetical protein
LVKKENILKSFHWQETLREKMPKIGEESEYQYFVWKNGWFGSDNRHEGLAATLFGGKRRCLAGLPDMVGEGVLDPTPSPEGHG